MGENEVHQIHMPGIGPVQQLWLSAGSPVWCLNVMDDNTGLGTSFAQLNRMSKLHCYECNKLLYLRSKCPKLKKNSHFQNEEGHNSTRASTPSGWAS